MATYNNSTSANQTITGRAYEANTFVNFGYGSDRLTGGQLNDTFILGTDNYSSVGFMADSYKDFIDGGLGRDRVDYSPSNYALDIRLSGASGVGSVQTKVGNGSFATYSVAELRSIEDATGSRFDDYISGTSGDNRLDGAQGHDDLYGGVGNDELIGGSGDDYLSGGSGDDILSGGANNDEIYTGTNRNTVDAGTGDDIISLEFDHQSSTAYRDTIEGGLGSDTLTSSENLTGNYGLQVSLSLGTASSIYYNGSITSTRQEATLSGIEHVNGTAQNDVIEGNDESNTLSGFDGRDLFEGRGGADTMFGGNGSDTFVSTVEDQIDYMYGDADVDTVIFSSTSDRGLLVTLADNGGMGTASTSQLSTSPNGATSTLITSVEDYLFSIENVTGTSFADNITGNSGNNELIGNAGLDTLSGGGGADILDGGADRDMLRGGAQADTFRFSYDGIGAEADFILDFQTGSDHIDFSPFYSNAAASHNTSVSDTPPEFIGSGAFSGDGNELRVFTNSSGQRVVELDMDGGGLTELDIQIFVTGQVQFADFLF